MTHNPYQPPSADMFLRAPALRTDFGFRLGWSLFWRVFMLQCFAVYAVDLLRHVPVDIVRVKQVLVSLVLVLVPVLSLFLTRQGALFVLFGDRLGLTDSAWRKFHWLLVAFYSTMTVWHMIAAFALVDLAPNIRIAVSLISLAFFFAIVPRLLRTQTDGK